MNPGILFSKSQFVHTLVSLIIILLTPTFLNGLQPVLLIQSPTYLSLPHLQCYAIHIRRANVIVQGALLLQKRCVDITCTDEVLVNNPDVLMSRPTGADIIVSYYWKQAHTS